MIFDGVDIIKVGSGIAPDVNELDGVEQKDALDGVEQKASLCPPSPVCPPPLEGLRPGNPGQPEGVDA